MAQGGTTNNGLQLPLSVAQGGTGLNTLPSGQILYASSTDVLSGLANAANGVFVTNNSSVPSCLAGPGVANYPLLSVASAAPAWAKIGFIAST